ncbi:MAG: 2-C-methyl-D-erythritol 2,4-cyclodiphosphate synthase [Gammaproteobacteria bacterium]|nr:2-C-methyl-D-erythritol 2,4-cyclodiphosphate synthase [Gammaproteobacteria bacterium]MBQ0840805.1 2-C-methyl-D-erythritol 2,4-cyclodiphosphate synthase [Gammaproteobacteria bacterium]
MIRVGQGFDVHAFADLAASNEAGQEVTIVLGGVSIPFSRPLLAHSDGDVLLHALCDALLGAAGLGDIGRHFPDTDSRYKNISSRHLLREVMALLKQNRWQLGNADLTIIAQAPRMAPHRAAMVENIAADLACRCEQVNVKATTTETLGFTGRGEGIACMATVLLESFA